MKMDMEGEGGVPSWPRSRRRGRRAGGLARLRRCRAREQVLMQADERGHRNRDHARAEHHDEHPEQLHRRGTARRRVDRSGVRPGDQASYRDDEHDPQHDLQRERHGQRIAVQRPVPPRPGYLTPQPGQPHEDQQRKRQHQPRPARSRDRAMPGVRSSAVTRNCRVARGPRGHSVRLAAGHSLAFLVRRMARYRHLPALAARVIPTWANHTRLPDHGPVLAPLTAVRKREGKTSRWCAKRVRASGWSWGRQVTLTWMVWYPVAPLGSVRCTAAVWVYPVLSVARTWTTCCPGV